MRLNKALQPTALRNADEPRRYGGLGAGFRQLCWDSQCPIPYLHSYRSVRMKIYSAVIERVW